MSDAVRGLKGARTRHGLPDHGYHAVCGARTRAGHPCRRQPVPGRSRCPNHGGCSTGPVTAEGRARALAALARGRETQRRQRERKNNER